MSQPQGLAEGGEAPHQPRGRPASSPHTRFRLQLSPQRARQIHNPGLREAIKTYSQWPTIPQARGPAAPPSRSSRPLGRRPSGRPLPRCATLRRPLVLPLPPHAPLHPHTHPQLYIDGEFVGGADITEQMVDSGELQTLLRKKVAA